MKKITFVLVVIGLIYYFFTQNSTWSRNTTDSTIEKTVQSSIQLQSKNFGASNEQQNKAHNNPTGLEVTSNNELTHERSTTPSIKGPEPTLNKSPQLTYTIDDGFAVTQGDIIIGEVPRNTIFRSLSGSVSEPAVQIWPTTEIPFFIQPNLTNPNRVHEALQFFSATNVHFVPYSDQQDAIVFEQGFGACKSYLGYIGGHQKIILSNGCAPKEIAHEIMHSLGFLHEQNRTDRDNYINLLWDNIDSKFRINFEKFSSSMMKVSGLAPFDFESLMIYPENMFSVNNYPTMKSKIEGQSIAPKQALSPKDIERINKTY